jgi:hypothetical protein
MTDPRTYIRREAAISVLISMTISAGFFLMLFDVADQVLPGLCRGFSAPDLHGRADGRACAEPADTKTHRKRHHRCDPRTVPLATRSASAIGAHGVVLGACDRRRGDGDPGGAGRRDDPVDISACDQGGGGRPCRSDRDAGRNPRNAGGRVNRKSLRLTGKLTRRFNSTLHAIESLPVAMEPT